MGKTKICDEPNKYQLQCTYNKCVHICLYFASQDGQDRKKRKENHATKVTKIKREIWDERSIYH